MNNRNWLTLLGASISLLISTYAYSLEKLSSFPQALVGAWIYETGDEKLDGCNTPRIMVSRTTITVVQQCIDEGNSVSRYRVKNVLVDRAFFSDEIKEYHVLTDGPNVVFDLLDDYGRSSIYLQFWVTDDYGPTRQLGVFNLRM
jgi:hypothetical protein